MTMTQCPKCGGDMKPAGEAPTNTLIVDVFGNYHHELIKLPRIRCEKCEEYFCDGSQSPIPAKQQQLLAEGRQFIVNATARHAERQRLVDVQQMCVVSAVAVGIGALIGSRDFTPTGIVLFAVLVLVAIVLTRASLKPIPRAKKAKKN